MIYIGLHTFLPPQGIYYTPPHLRQDVDGFSIVLQNPPFNAPAPDAPASLAGPGMYQTAQLAPHLGKGTMLEVLATIDADTPAARTETGAELRRTVTDTPAQFARAVQRIGEMYIELVRADDRWGLYLSDLTPIRHGIRDQWATAVGAPSVEWQRTEDGCVVWCEWTEPTR